jgi:tetratricopeptide (TPR) repeat protein
MRTLRTLLLAATLSCSAASIADQKSDALPDLFGQLKLANSPQQAVMIEAEIWKKWYERDDKGGGDSMGQIIESMAAGRYTVALNLLNQLVDDQPDFAEAWNRRATIHYLLGNYQDSLADIEQTLQLEPRHFGALSGIGLIMQQLGENEKALHAFEQVLEISPHNLGATKSVKELETRLGLSI